MSNISLSGYTGVFKQPIQGYSQFSSTIYIVSDIDKKELCLILLTPESYSDAYNIIKNVGIQNIIVFIPTLDTSFLTNCNDINLLKNIEYIKPSTKLIYPTKLDPKTYTIIYNSFIKSNFYQNSINPSITVEYIPSGVSSRWYDILVKDGETSKYFCQYLNEEKLSILYNDKSINQIHIAYNSVNCGGINYIEAILINEKYKNKLYAHSFLTDTDFTEAKVNGINIGPYIAGILLV